MTDTRDNIADDAGVIDPDRAEGGAVEAPQLSEIEQLAADMGWDPNHKGTETKPARTAAEWIKSTNKQNRNLKDEIKELKSSVERIIVASDKQVRREVQEQAREIQARFEEAVKSKDTAGAAKAAQDMRELEAEQQPRADNRSIEDRFAQENPWYGKDEDATAYAISISQREAAKGVADPAKQIEAVVAAVRKRFPEHFEESQAPAPKPQPSVHSPGRPVQQRRTTGFADMPEIAKNAANRTYDAMKMRNGDKVPDRKAFEAQYAKDYFSDQAA